MTDFEVNNFTNYEAAKAMKEVGFEITPIEITTNGAILSVPIDRPLFAQCVRWFREKHQVVINVYFSHEDKFGFSIIKSAASFGNWELIETAYEETEPEAYNAAIIKACELVKENDKNLK